MQIVLRMEAVCEYFYFENLYKYPIVQQLRTIRMNHPGQNLYGHQFSEPTGSGGALGPDPLINLGLGGWGNTAPIGTSPFITG